MESMKLKAISKGKVKYHYHILYFMPTLTRCPHIVIEDEKKKTKVRDEVYVDLPFYQPKVN